MARYEIDYFELPATTGTDGFFIASLRRSG